MEEEEEEERRERILSKETSLPCHRGAKGLGSARSIECHPSVKGIKEKRREEKIREGEVHPFASSEEGVGAVGAPPDTLKYEMEKEGCSERNAMPWSLNRLLQRKRVR